MVTPATPDARHRSDGSQPTPSQAQILVINPNSSRAVTAAIRDALRPCQTVWTRFTVEQIDQAPRAIATAEDHHTVTPLVVQTVTQAAGAYDAIVIACHGDPGVHESRHHTPIPVLGIGECSFHIAAAATGRFAVLTLSDALLERKWGQIRAAGLERFCAAVIPTNTSVEHGASPRPDLTPYEAAGRQAIQAGAQTLILGCAGMSPLATRLAAKLHVAVIDPVVAAAQMTTAIATPTAHTSTVTSERSLP